MLRVSRPTTIFPMLTMTLRTRVNQSTRRTPERVTSIAAWALSLTRAPPSFHPRALFLDREYPADHLAWLYEASRAPERPVAKEARGALGGRNGEDLRFDPLEAF